MRAGVTQRQIPPAGAPVGLFGGTFDPVHLGHLRTALEILEGCGLAEIRFIPCGTPAHRPLPVASSELRVAMLRAAVAAEPRFVVDEREVLRPGPSYTFDTLTALRAEHGRTPLCLILGADAFLGLQSWHRWSELVDLAHLILIQRPGWSMPEAGALHELLRQRRVVDVRDLAGAPAGSIWIQPVSQLDISSSAIRSLVAAGGDPGFLVPEPVRALIMASRCFNPGAAAATG